ncbi:MAG: manganese efflux pump MntP family protein [Coprobacillaceae bacterium]
MTMWELFVIAVGLSMDAFAVSICKGLSTKELTKKQTLITGLYFGGFQAAMPILGYLLGFHFQSMITEIDHWIAFVLLGAIGINMIRGAKDDGEEIGNSFSFKEMLPLAIATSIDALAVGITFAFLQVQIVPAVSFIGIITFSLSIIGVYLGKVFGTKLKSMAEIAGGVVLIIMGIKIVLEHLAIL